MSKPSENRFKPFADIEKNEEPKPNPPTIPKMKVMQKVCM
jgi:hypothetical protein